MGPVCASLGPRPSVQAWPSRGSHGGWGVPPNHIVALNTFLGLQEACVGPSSTGLLGLLGRVDQGLCRGSSPIRQP